MTTEADARIHGVGPSFTIIVDGEELTVTEHELTPTMIMERAGIANRSRARTTSSYGSTRG